LRLKVTILDKSFWPLDAAEYLVEPGQELALDPVTWISNKDHAGLYKATATIEYTSDHMHWNSWGKRVQQTFYFWIWDWSWWFWHWHWGH
jgi:hypothetical protein